MVKWTKVTVTGNRWNLFGKHIIQNDIHLLVDNLENPPNAFQPVVEKKNEEKKSRMGFLRWLEIFRNSSSVCPWRQGYQPISKMTSLRTCCELHFSTFRIPSPPAEGDWHHFEATNLHLIPSSALSKFISHHETLQWFYYLSPISHYPNSQPNPLDKAGCISKIQPTRLYLRHQPNRVTQTYPTNASELTQHFATRSLEPSNWMSSNDSKASVLRPTQGPERNASSSLC